MSSYKLTYFNGMGRAEGTRLLFALCDVKYEDVRISGPEWKELKPKTPFGGLPILEVDGETLCQGKAIGFFVAKRLGRAGENDLQMAKAHMIVECVADVIQAVSKTMTISNAEEKKKITEDFCKNTLPEGMKKFEALLQKSNHKSGLFLGDKITWPDVVLFQLFEQLKVLDYMTVDVSGFSKVTALINKVKTDPKIAAWVEKRPKTSF